MKRFLSKICSVSKNTMGYFAQKPEALTYLEPARLVLPEYQVGDLLISPVEHALWGNSAIILEIFESIPVFDNPWEYLVLLDDGSTHVVIEGALDGWVLQSRAENNNKK
jgi:hypothetical protein